MGRLAFETTRLHKSLVYAVHQFFFFYLVFLRKQIRLVADKFERSKNGRNNIIITIIQGFDRASDCGRV